jgi:hypothetical protein
VKKVEKKQKLAAKGLRMAPFKDAPKDFAEV